ncbi:MAG: hypothetical protein QMD04_01140 [Anaerolineales bacterium]|nr:hypothetical protein [Anaerolineales bacterium]
MSSRAPDSMFVSSHIQSWLGGQFHPEFLSRPNRAHPLFKAFVHAVTERARSKASP